MLIALLITSLAMAGSPCTPPTTSADVVAQANRARAALDTMEMREFQQRVHASLDALPCLNQPLTPEEAAVAHEMAAYALFSKESPSPTIAQLQAVVELDPDFALPHRFDTAGNPMKAALAQALTAPPSAMTALLVPAAFTAMVDGDRAVTAPVSRPFVLQLLQPDHTVVWSGMVDNAAARPDWVALGLVDEKTWDRQLAMAARDQRKAARGEHPLDDGGGSPHTPTIAGAAGAFALSGIFYGMAAHYSHRLHTADSPDIQDHEATVQATSDLLEYHARTNEMLIASSIFGIAGLTLGVSAFLSVQF